MSNKEISQQPSSSKDRIDQKVHSFLIGVSRKTRIGLAVAIGSTSGVGAFEGAKSADNPESARTTIVRQVESAENTIGRSIIVNANETVLTSDPYDPTAEKTSLPENTTLTVEGMENNHFRVFTTDKNGHKSIYFVAFDNAVFTNNAETEQEEPIVASTEPITASTAITGTETITNTQEVQVFKKTVTTTVKCNARSTPNTSSPENIITVLDEGEVLEVTGEVVNDENGLISWRQVRITQDDGTDIEAWLSTTVISELNIEAVPPTSQGVGGPVQTPSTSITETDTNSETGESVQELSPAQDSMNRALPENFREYYESYGGNISWNSELQTYEVTFKTQTGEKKFILLPETGAKLTDESDLAAGLYFLGEEASLKITKEVDGEQVEQAIHFVVSPNFPNFDGHNFWADLPTSLEQDTEITITTITEEQKTQIAEALIKMFGLDDSGSFNLFLGVGGDIKENFEDSEDRPLQVRGLNSGSNDSETVFAKVTNQRSDKQTLLGIISPMKDLSAERLLLNPELKQYYGSGLFWTLLERLVTDAPWRTLKEDEAIMNISDFQKFYEQFTDIVFPVEAVLTEKNGGTFKHVFDISIDPTVVRDYIDHLSEN